MCSSVLYDMMLLFDLMKHLNAYPTRV